MTENSAVPGTSERPALVTGAGRNIGAEIARTLAASGHPVALCARRSDEIAAVAAEIEQGGGRAISSPVDVSDADGVQAFADRAAEELGAPVQILVNNAVQRIQLPFLEMPVDEWHKVLEITLTGAFNNAKAVLPGMRAAGWGRIISFSGLAGEAGAWNRAGIVTAKNAIIGFTKALALEGAADGITANAISPGIIGTKRDAHQFKGMVDEALAKRHYAEETELIPAGRMGYIDEVVAACEYLISDRAAFVTGQTLSVNGGRYP